MKRRPKWAAFLYEGSMSMGNLDGLWVDEPSGREWQVYQFENDEDVEPIFFASASETSYGWEVEFEQGFGEHPKHGTVSGFECLEDAMEFAEEFSWNPEGEEA